jgi:hypothetical protein
MSHKRLYKLNTQHQEQYKENTTLPIMAQTTSSFTFSHSNSNNNNNSNSDMSQDTLDSDTSDDKLQQGQVEMMDYDLTDEDESLQTPSSMNDFTVIEEDESDFIGDLEKGWIEMFSESYYPYY